MYPSKEQVSCFHCEWVGRKDKSKEHCKSKHPEQKFKLKISENSLQNSRFQKETIENITTTTTTTTTTTDNNNDVANEEQADVVVLSPCGATSTVSSGKAVTSPLISVLDTPSALSTPSNISTASSPSKCFKSPTSVQDQLACMTKPLVKLADAIENIHVEKTSNESSSFTQADELERTFDCIKCSDDFLMLRRLKINENLNTITCIPCSIWKKQAPKHLSASMKSSFGVFKYIEQKLNEPLSERFRNLKKHLKIHFANQLHTWCMYSSARRKTAGIRGLCKEK